MVLVLCIGDLHIPHRAIDLPPKFKELLKPGKIHHTLCTGNLCSKTVFDYLRTVCSDIHVAQGDFDDLDKPDHVVLELEDFKIGICHGHQIVPWGSLAAASSYQRQLGVDILVTGHTHEYKVTPGEGLLIINPGSATGAYSTLSTQVAPSFVLMDLDGSKATVYVYQLADGDVKVEKIDYVKPEAGAAAAAAAAAEARI